jgi:hypothetical protein
MQAEATTGSKFAILTTELANWTNKIAAYHHLQVIYQDNKYHIHHHHLYMRY